MAVAIIVAGAIAFMRPNTSTAPSLGDSTTQLPLKRETPKFMPVAEATKGAIHAALVVDGRGTIEMELYPAAAPKTVAHIVALCKRSFYKGILVHRVEDSPTFRLFQAGDPKTITMDPNRLRGKTTTEVSQQLDLGSGGSGTNVPLEAHMPNVKYSVGLARSDDEGSGDSQFYINLIDNSLLDGKYCIFGKVISGQSVAEQVRIGDRITEFTIH